MALHADMPGNLLVESMERIETAASLDGAVEGLSRVADRLGGSAAIGPVLRGRWLGHPFHPLLTDFAEGAWIAGTFLDLFGPPGSAPAARRLHGLGLSFAVPTYLTGLASFAALRSAPQRRLAAAHTASISLAIVMYAASYAARRKGAERRAKVLAVAAGVVAFADGYLGGHLRHPPADLGADAPTA